MTDEKKPSLETQVALLKQKVNIMWVGFWGIIAGGFAYIGRELLSLIGK